MKFANGDSVEWKTPQGRVLRGTVVECVERRLFPYPALAGKLGTTDFAAEFENVKRKEESVIVACKRGPGFVYYRPRIKSVIPLGSDNQMNLFTPAHEEAREPVTTRFAGQFEEDMFWHHIYKARDSYSERHVREALKYI